MLDKPTKASRNTLDQNKHGKSTTLQTAQHGDLHRNRNSSSLSERGAPLLDVPGESLTHITSYLDVPALLNLSRVNKSMHEHVNNDSTWYRALLCQFLGVSPESDPRGVQSLILRRTESTWKKELVHRHITCVCVPDRLHSLTVLTGSSFLVAGKDLALPRSPTLPSSAGSVISVLCQRAGCSLHQHNMVSCLGQILSAAKSSEVS